MAFQLSPGVNFTERDLTNVIPSVATTAGGFCGDFAWGPVNEPVLIDSVANLRSTFALPDSRNFRSWFSASAVLGYGNNLTIVRVIGASASNAHAGGATSALEVLNDDDYETQTFTNRGNFVAKYPGDLGNSIGVAICDNIPYVQGSGTTTGVAKIVLNAPNVAGDGFTRGSVVALADGASTGNSLVTGTARVLDFQPAANGAAGSVLYVKPLDGDFVDNLYAGGTGANYVWQDYEGDTTDVSTRDVSYNVNTNSAVGATTPSQGTAFAVWDWKGNFEGEPGTSEYASILGGSNDEFHLLVYDKDGVWTGEAGTVLERFPYLSKASDAKSADGLNNYYVDVLRNQSAYLWATGSEFAGVTGSGAVGRTAQNTAFGSFGPRADLLANGSDGTAAPTEAARLLGYQTYFSDPEQVDVQLLVGGEVSTQTGDADTQTVALAQGLIDIAEARRDCIAFLSPPYGAIANNRATPNNIQADIIAFRNKLTSTSYAVLDSGYKKIVDPFNDTERIVPLNPDTAGLCIRTDRLADAWYSPAGFNRGQVRNTVKLMYNPSKTDRDLLYSSGVNPVVSFPGEGTVLFGDKTLLSRPSAFDRINVRRLFIVLEKAISTAAKFQLFEFNNAATRAAFRNLVEPFLNNVQGRQGLTDFSVVCDETNNTPDVIDGNQFVADVYIKPTRSINFIQLNFVATPTGANFTEIANAL